MGIQVSGSMKGFYVGFTFGFGGFYEGSIVVSGIYRSWGSCSFLWA